MEARSKALTGFIALSCASAVIGCGGGARQDADEPEGNFDVAVVSATFPKQQKLAQTSQLAITVENTGKEAVPNLAVTVDGLGYRATQPNLANPERPRFAVTGIPRQIGGFPEAKDATPLGCDTAYVNTWACGPLKPGKQTKLVWQVTAVKAGPYKITWRVAGGLNGKAKAVTSGGGTPTGSFAGTVSRAAPQVRIAADGKTVVTESP
ncbi:MAG TPA: hypothetical protein VHR40_07285 [Thermoleophilaceae bacterium]|nr:hypothetical protein [Thermoleophilaceae bacterium]